MSLGAGVGVTCDNAFQLGADPQVSTDVAGDETVDPSMWFLEITAMGFVIQHLTDSAAQIS